MKKKSNPAKFEGENNKRACKVFNERQPKTENHSATAWEVSFPTDMPHIGKNMQLIN